MKRPFIAALVCAQLVALPLPAQQTEPTKYVEQIDVRVINVDVVVTDRKGNVVRGLTADAFEVLENGKIQKISNFYEVTTAKPAAPATETQLAVAQPAAAAEEETPEHLRRKIIIFVDNLSLSPFNRNRVFAQMKRFINETMRPGDEAMVATWNRSLKVRVPFTEDTVQIEQSLEGILTETSYGLQNIAERRAVEERIRNAQSYDDAMAAARGYAQSVEHDLRTSASALNSLMSTLAGVEGKKILLLTSEGFPIQPGREMFFFIDEIKREKNGWRTSASALIEGAMFDSSRVIESMARTANANSITMYTLHAGGLMASTDGAADNSKPLPPIVQQQLLTNSTDSLLLMADMTGGRSTTGTNNFTAAFDNIKKDLESYYSIGYRSGTERVDRQRSVAVRMKDRNLTARSRKTFVEKSVPTEMTDRVIANLFYPSKTNDLGIIAVTGTPVQVSADRFKLPLELRIPMKSLTLLPQGAVRAGGFSVYVAAANQYGDMSEVTSKSQPLQVPEGDMASIDGKHFTWTTELLLEKGRNKISIGVIDEVTNAMSFERREVLAADLR